MSIENEKATLEKVMSRIASTPNEDLAKILDKLLPGLIPLSNRTELRPQVLTIISNITRRMKSLQTSIICSNLLIKLVKPEMMPYACNIALSVIDISIDYIPVTDRTDCCLAIIQCLENFQGDFSNQTTSLLSYIPRFLSELASIPAPISTKVRHLISDWLLDISLVQPGLKKDGVGSIQPGLSPERVRRLTSKIDKWFLPDLSNLKLQLLEYASLSWIEPPYALAIFAVCACDIDPDVAKQATHRLNGVKTAFKDSHSEMSRTLVFLIHFCLISIEQDQNQLELSSLSQLEMNWLGWSIVVSYKMCSGEESLASGLELRTALREDVRHQMLKWITNEGSTMDLSKLRGSGPSLIDGVSTSILQLIRRTFAGINEFKSKPSLESIQYAAICLDLVYAWFQKPTTPVDILAEACPILMKCCFRSLSRYLVQSRPSLIGQDEVDLILKRKSYLILDYLARKVPGQMTQDIGIEIVTALFRLLEIENDAIVTILLTALESLRVAFQNSTVHHLSVSSNILLMKQLIQGARSSSIPRKRLLALSWSKAIFGWSPVTMDSLLYLTGDQNEIVSSSAIAEFRKLHNDIKENKFDAMVLTNIFASLLEFKTIFSADYASSHPPTLGYLRVAEQIFLTANIIFQSLLSTAFSDIGDLNSSPFIGPSLWPHLRRQIISLPTPPLRTDLVSKMAEFLGKDISIGSPRPIGLMNEMVLLGRNCCLLGDEESNQIVHSHLQNILRFLEFVSLVHVRFVSQTLGLLAINLSDATFLPLNWRILQHKIQHGVSEVKIGALFCATSIIEGSLSPSSEIVHMLKIHFDTLIDWGLEESCDLSLQLAALENLGILCASQIIPTPEKSSPVHLVQLLHDLGYSINSILKKLTFRLTSANLNPLLISTIVQTLSRICSVEGVSPDQAFTTSEFLINSPLKSHVSRNVRMDLAESIVRLSLNPRAPDLLLWRESLISRLESFIFKPEPDIKEMGFAAIALLVLIKQGSHFSPSIFDPDSLYRISTAFLAVIRGGSRLSLLPSECEPFVQDICCAGLCHIFHLSTRLTHSNLNSSLYRSSAEKIASVVISTLCREKKSLQPPGFAVAGERSDQIPSNADQHQDFDRVLTQIPISLDGRIGYDALAEAVATASRELNIYTDAQPTDAQPPPSRRNDDENYGIYTKVCKVAKKTGDASVVFAVLGLIRRDPSFGLIESESEAFYNTYRPPTISIEQDKIRKILPMLYLARFDPNEIIREVMKTLWGILIPVEQESVLLSTHCDAILSELSNNLKSKQWKDRESACLALETFIPQRPWSKLRPSLQILWDNGMNVLDDIRDSTRRAALGFMKTFANQIVSACNPEVTDSAHLFDRENIIDDTTSFIIPLLLDKGLLAPSPEGKGFSLGLLLRIVKTARVSLKDHLIRLIFVLVESMSAMEPSSLQYMEFHTERLQISTSELESTRLKLSQLSPLQDALDICLESLQSPSSLPMISEIITNLSTQTLQGVGLATRVTAARSIVYIVNCCPVGWSDSLKQRCFHSLISSLIPSPPTSQSLKKEITLAVATLSKICDAQFLGDQILKLLSLYRSFRHDDEQLTEVIANCIELIISKTGDSLRDEIPMWKVLIRCSYIGSFEANQGVRTAWETLFLDVIIQSGFGTREASVKVVFLDLLQDITNLLGSLSWSKRIQGLSAIDDLVSLFPSGLIAPNATVLLVSLLKLLPGQMWTGKENALRTLSSVLEKCPQCLDDSLPTQTFFSMMGGSQNCVILLEDMSSKALLLEKLKECLSGTSSLHSQFNFEIGDEMKIPSHWGWKMSWSGIIQYFYEESLRGDRQYRFVVASALSTLPWKSLQSPLAIRTALSFVEIFLECAGMGVLVGQEDKLPQRDSNASNIRVDKPKNQLDLFGGRYGQDFSSKQIKQKGTKSNNSKELDLIETEEAKEDSLDTDFEDVNEAKTTLQRDPAHRLKYLETVAKMWPSNNFDSHQTNKSFRQLIRPFLDWALQFHQTEVWSIRRGMINILLAFTSYDLDETELRDILHIIESNANDPKYSQVRTASAEVLAGLISSQKSATVKSTQLRNPPFAGQIQRILAVLSLDTSPSVLVPFSRAQQEWSNF